MVFIIPRRPPPSSDRILNDFFFGFKMGFGILKSDERYEANEFGLLPGMVIPRGSVKDVGDDERELGDVDMNAYGKELADTGEDDNRGVLTVFVASAVVI
jgi:hypothetical protein